MREKVLCVDDDPNILDAYRRALRRQFDVETVLGGREALEKIASSGPYGVVVADMRMPEMNGVELLARVKQIAPDTVRMMLTGNADQQTALEAVNQGQIFRFLNKPCPPEAFAAALEAGLRQHRLIVAERELLSNTLGGAVKVLTDVLSLLKPKAFGRAGQVRQLVHALCEELEVKSAWVVEVAATLSQIGCIAVPEEILEKVYEGQPLTAAEQETFQQHSKTGHELLRNIPRLEEVAQVVGYQEKLFDGRGFPPDYRRGEEIPLGSRILKLALDWSVLLSSGLAPEMALAHVRGRVGWYDPDVVAALKRVLRISEDLVVTEVRIDSLVDGSVLADDVMSIHGTLLCAKGQEVNAAVRCRLKNYMINVGIDGPLKVFIPAGKGPLRSEPAEARTTEHVYVQPPGESHRVPRQPASSKRQV